MPLREGGRVVWAPSNMRTEEFLENPDADVDVDRIAWEWRRLNMLHTEAKKDEEENKV